MKYVHGDNFVYATVNFILVCGNLRKKFRLTGLKLQQHRVVRDDPHQWRGMRLMHMALPPLRANHRKVHTSGKSRLPRYSNGALLDFTL